MNRQQAMEEVKAIRADRERIAELLWDYPRIDSGETGEILAYLKTARHLDVGLLSSDRRIGAKLERFMEEHKAHFELTAREAVAVIAVIVGLLAIAWLIWEAFQ